ncbi:MAG: hypothetical protein NTZ46_06865 [Verrucomicrobia bacterium]|nr:hypothetical protein [Verrucomicrobiota bacterium]
METKEKSMCPQCVEAMAKAETTIREHPGEAAIASLCVGFLIAQLPLRLLMSAIARLILLVLKPTVLLYGVYKMAEDVQARPENGTEPTGQAAGI